MNNLAHGYKTAGQLDRALPLFERTLVLRQSKLGPDHPHTLTSMSNLASCYQAVGKLDRAILLDEQTLSLRKSKLGPDHPDTLISMNNLAYDYRAVGQFDRALPLFEETLTLQKAGLGPDHPDTLASTNNLINCYQAAGQPDRAVPILRDVADIWKRKEGPDSSRYAGALVSLGLAFLQDKKWTEAESIFREAMAIRERKAPELWSTLNTKSLLGGALLGQKKRAEAEPLLNSGFEGMKQRANKIPSQAKIRLIEALDRLIELAEATGKPDEAGAWRDEKAQLVPSTPRPETLKP